MKPDYSKLSPDLQEKIKGWEANNPANKQLTKLNDIASILQDVSNVIDYRGEQSDKTLKELGTVLTDAREQLVAMNAKEAPETPDTSQPVIDTTPAIEVQADIKGTLTGEVQVLAGQIAPYIKGTMARKQTLLVQGIGEVHQALPKKIGTIALDVSIGATPSAFDIAQAVWLQVATAVDVPNTTGAKLNAAGSSGDPWTSPKALTVGKFIALK